MEPSDVEISAWASVDHVLEWAQLEVVSNDAKTIRGALFRVLGRTGSEHWRELAFMAEGAFADVHTWWEIAGSAPTLAQMSQAGLVVFGVRKAGRGGSTQDTSSTLVPTTRAGTLNLSEVTGQGVGGDCAITPTSDDSKCFNCTRPNWVLILLRGVIKRCSVDQGQLATICRSVHLRSLLCKVEETSPIPGSTPQRSRRAGPYRNQWNLSS
eukprot:4256667-Amphidinium_carterae.1